MSETFSDYVGFLKRTRLEDEGDGHGAGLLPRGDSDILRFISSGVRGIREPKGRVKGYRVEVRPSGWSRKIWVGTFHQLRQAMRAYDATLHYTDKIPYYFIYPEGSFRPCPPGFENVPQTEEFVSFVKRMAKEFARKAGNLHLNPALRVTPAIFSGIRVVVDGDRGEGSTLSAAATPPIPSSARPLSKRSSGFVCKAEVICLPSSTESESIRGKGVEEVEVVSNASPPLLVPEVIYNPESATTEDRSFRFASKMDSPTAEDIPNLLFPTADAVAADELDVLFWPELAKPNVTERTRVAGFKMEPTRDSSAMPGAEKPNRVTASFQTVFHGLNPNNL